MCLFSVNKLNAGEWMVLLIEFILVNLICHSRQMCHQKCALFCSSAWSSLKFREHIWNPTAWLEEMVFPATHGNTVWDFNICISRMMPIVMLKCAHCEREYGFLAFLTPCVLIPLRLRVPPVLVLCLERILKQRGKGQGKGIGFSITVLCIHCKNCIWV